MKPHICSGIFFSGDVVVNVANCNGVTRLGLSTFPFYTGMISGYIYSVIIGALESRVQTPLLVGEKIRSCRPDSEEKQKDLECVIAVAEESTICINAPGAGEASTGKQ